MLQHEDGVRIMTTRYTIADSGYKLLHHLKFQDSVLAEMCRLVPSISASKLRILTETTLTRAIGSSPFIVDFKAVICNCSRDV